MTTYTTQWIYLGMAAEMDTNESNWTNENDAVPIGSYGVGDMELADITVDDVNDDGVVRSDDNGTTPEPFSYTTSGGTVDTFLDSGSRYNAEVTLSDGSTMTLILDVFQTVDGGLFVSHDLDLDGLTIANIELTSFDSDSYWGIGHLVDYGIDGATIACFASQTLIETNRGLVSIDDLAVGDLVRTADHGMQSIRWIGSSTVAARGKNAPILIRKGALGNDRDLLVSPFHRMLVSDWRTEVLFGEAEVLTPAVHLCNDQTIRRREGGKITYFHMMFDRHEIVYAEGTPSESFHPSQDGIGNLADESRAEILRLFPVLAAEPAAYGPVARPCISAAEVSVMLGR